MCGFTPRRCLVRSQMRLTERNFNCFATWRRRTLNLSYNTLDRLTGDMRRPHRTELEFTMLLFASLVPLGYYTVRWLFALLG